MTVARPRRPQLTIEELQQLKWLLGGVLTLIGLSTVFYMDVEAWTITALTAGATLTTMIRPTLPARMPSLVHTLAFPAIVAFFVADMWLMTEVLPAMVRLDILLLLYRNISYRQRRDDLQIIVLGLFLVVVAGVLTVSLTFAGQILVYTGAALALLLVVTLCDAVLGIAHRAPVPLGEVAPGPTAPVARATRRIWLDGRRVEARVYDRATLGRGAQLVGPAIVEQPDTTVLVPGGHTGDVDRFGNLILRRHD